MVFPAAPPNLSPDQKLSHTLDQAVRLSWCAVYDLYTAIQLGEWYGFIQHHSSLPVLLYSFPNHFHQSIFLLITASHRAGSFPDWTALLIIWLIYSADCLSICSSQCCAQIHTRHLSHCTWLLSKTSFKQNVISLDQ